MLTLLLISVTISAIGGQMRESPPFPTPDVIRQCEHGSALTPGTGRPIVCSPFVPVGTNQCPAGSFCRGGPADEPGLCCLMRNPCRRGRPYAVNGNAPTCRGLEGLRSCPRGFQCITNTQPLSAVCCPAFTPGGGCPPGVPIVNCFVDPCQVTRCPRIPFATCRSNYCGGCNARFFLNGRDVTRFCRRRPYQIA